MIFNFNIIQMLRNLEKNINLYEYAVINKFTLTTSSKIPYLKYAKLMFSIRDKETNLSMDFLKSFFILEMIGLQKSKSQKKRVSLKGRGKMQLFFSNITILRKFFLYNFLYFFFFFLLPEMPSKFLKINKKIVSSLFYFKLKDLSLIPGIAEFFQKWSYPLFCFFIMNRKNHPMFLQLFLRYFGIKIDIIIK